jgi:DNA-binding NtrC family response regulator
MLDWITLAVVKLSDAFSDFWRDLSRDLKFRLEIIEDPDQAIPPGTDAVIVAAGGAEREAVEWLEAGVAGRATQPILVVGADPRRRTAVKIIRAGGQDYLVLPADLELLRNAVSEFIRQQGRPATRNTPAQSGVDSGAFRDIVGDSAALKEVLWLAARLLPRRDATVLILGETGTGKELLARALHSGGPRAGGPFVPVNCSALPANLVESELFGHERGAFTDAHAAKPGLFEIAQGGTLFLDEIGDLPLDVQAKLLRVLDDRHIRRVGGTAQQAVDVRIVAATNENLEAAVRAGDFREDLYYRLSVVVLRMPPLRSRDTDVILIAQDLLGRACLQHDLPVPTLSDDAKSALIGHSWPGNIRELKNVMERALLLSPPGELYLDPRISTPRTVDSDTSAILPFPASLHEIARSAARATLEQCGGNRSESARRLGISRRRLRGLLDEIGPDEERMA